MLSFSHTGTVIYYPNVPAGLPAFSLFSRYFYFRITKVCAVRFRLQSRT